MMNILLSEAQRTLRHVSPLFEERPFDMASGKMVILGAGGLVGARLCTLIQKTDTMHISPEESVPLTKIVLFDMNEPNAVLPHVLADPRVSVQLGDLCDEETIRKLIDPDGCTHVTTIHLAALLSGYAEDNFDLGMKVNLYGTLNVMERVRELKEKLGAPQIYTYVSTDYVACYNEWNRTHPVTEESFRLSPVSYGVQKACNELLICDYTRKGFFDGRVARLSAVIGRPGFSNSISYPYTGIFTQPLEGKVYDVPLPMEVPYPCSALNNNVEALLYLSTKVDGSKLGHNRVVQMPCASFTLSMIWQACQEVAKEEGVPLGSIRQVAANAGATSVKEINVCPVVSCDRARDLGFPMDTDLKSIIRDYIKTYVKK